MRGRRAGLGILKKVSGLERFTSDRKTKMPAAVWIAAGIARKWEGSVVKIAGGRLLERQPRSPVRFLSRFTPPGVASQDRVA
jgi:hypothetical protein